MGWTPFSGHTPENLIMVARGAADELSSRTADASRVRDILNELISRYSAQVGAQAGEAAVRIRKPSDGPDLRATEHYGAAPLDRRKAWGQFAAQSMQNTSMAEQMMRANQMAAQAAQSLTASALAAQQRQYAEYMRNLLARAEALTAPPIVVPRAPEITGVFVDECAPKPKKTLLEQAREWLRK